MWVKSEQGKLHNLIYAESVDIETRPDGLLVVARFGGEAGRTVELTEVKRNEVEPMAVLKRILTSIQDNDRVLDLEKSANQVRRPLL